jgi:hypothetical protein
MPSSENYKRDYKQELLTEKRNHPEKAKKRARNNKARREMIRAGKARVGDGLDVAHLNNDTRDSKLGNLQMQKPAKNRSFKRDKSAGRLGKDGK